MAFCFRHGKTTLLNHIANRALRIPPNIDVLICEQGRLPSMKMVKKSKGIDFLYRILPNKRADAFARADLATWPACSHI